MAYSVLARRLLISCPGDVPIGDLHLVHNAINRWNGIYGERFGAAIIPISWGTNAAAEFGEAPQDLLNKQIVDRCDICLALFANRLGTPTASAESGTAEEIERISESGRYVGVLRSRREVDSTQIDPGQLMRLNEYLTRIETKALVLTYANDAELIERVDNILVAAVARDQGRAELQLQQTAQPSMRNAEVWPRAESQERRDGIRDWVLVVANTGNAPAQSVSVRFRDLDGSVSSWEIVDAGQDSEAYIEVLGPHSEARFDLFHGFGDPVQMNCFVSWSDERGVQENMATLRLV
jgi:hypothetical protein